MGRGGARGARGSVDIGGGRKEGIGGGYCRGLTGGGTGGNESI